MISRGIRDKADQNRSLLRNYGFFFFIKKILNLKSKKNFIIPESQPTLTQFVGNQNEILPEYPNNTNSEDDDDNSNKLFDNIKKKLINLVKIHQLNEIIVIFKMADQMILQFDRNEIKSLYSIVQNEMILEFGAPLSPSLFPSLIFN